jgi:glyoxylase-like metal-dependent hydrolase (beta-lactamase superfamily II)
MNTRAMRRLLVLLVLLVIGCGGSKEPASPTSSSAASKTSTKKEEGTLTKNGDLLTYVSIPWGFSTSSYVIEGSKGLVAIDTQFLPSAAEEMIAKAEAMTKKKFVLAIVLHANPDKFNGTATFQKHGVKVITSEQVKKVMPEVHEKRVRAFYDRYAPDYPKDLPNPDVFGNATQEMNVEAAGGVKLRLHVLGAGCSEAHVVVERPDTQEIFVGDMVANKHHSWLEIGKTDQWLTRLDEMKKMTPKTVHPGRGASGPASLLDDEEAYLKRVMSIVAAEKPAMPVKEEALERAEKAIVDAYPGYGHPVFLKIGLPAEWERQAKSASHAKP